MSLLFINRDLSVCESQMQAISRTVWSLTRRPRNRGSRERATSHLSTVHELQRRSNEGEVMVYLVVVVVGLVHSATLSLRLLGVVVRFSCLALTLTIVSPYCAHCWLHDLRCRGLLSKAAHRQSSLSRVRQALRQRGQPQEASRLPSGDQPAQHEPQDVAVLRLPIGLHERKWWVSEWDHPNDQFTGKISSTFP